MGNPEKIRRARAARSGAKKATKTECGAVFRRIGSGPVRTCRRAHGHAGEHAGANVPQRDSPTGSPAAEGAQLMVPGVPPLDAEVITDASLTTQTLRMTRIELQRQRVQAAIDGHANWTAWALATLRDAAAVRS